MRTSLVFWLGCAALAGGALFHTSYRVQALEETLSDLNREIIREQEHIQVLNADWSYLNDPSRLEQLATRHLPLQPTEVAQLAELGILPSRQAETAVVERQDPAVRPSRPSVPAAASSSTVTAARVMAPPRRTMAQARTSNRRPSAQRVANRSNAASGGTDEIGLLLATLGAN